MNLVGVDPGQKDILLIFCFMVDGSSSHAETYHLSGEGWRKDLNTANCNEIRDREKRNFMHEAQSATQMEELVWQGIATYKPALFSIGEVEVVVTEVVIVLECKTDSHQPTTGCDTAAPPCASSTHRGHRHRNP